MINIVMIGIIVLTTMGGLALITHLVDKWKTKRAFKTRRKLDLEDSFDMYIEALRAGHFTKKNKL